jgi:threonine/homoserine/homoserine lactone efflux protein
VADFERRKQILVEPPTLADRESTLFGTHDLFLFVVSGLLVCVVPGPDTLYIVGRSSTQGFQAGATAALGIGLGIFVHITAAAVGLSAILATSSSVFMLVKIAGAAYLVCIGLSMIRAPRVAPEPELMQKASPATLRVILLQGFLTDVLNVKVALFFLAFLPQFVTTDATSKPVAFLFLGMIFNLTAIVWNLFVAWSSARIASGVRRSATLATWANRFAGGLLVYMGIRIALSRQI